MIDTKNAQKELIWLYNKAHHDLNITSSHSSIISAIYYGAYSPTDARNAQENRLIAIATKASQPCRKIAIIQETLAQLPNTTRRILDALYGNYLYPPELTAAFGEDTGAALFNTYITNLNELINLTRNQSTNSKNIGKQINKQAKQIHQSALGQYAAIRSRNAIS